MQILIEKLPSLFVVCLRYLSFFTLAWGNDFLEARDVTKTTASYGQLGWLTSVRRDFLINTYVYLTVGEEAGTSEMKRNIQGYHVP